MPPQTRGLTAIAGAMCLIAILLIVQIWLLSAALESFLSGNHRTALPAAIFSGAMLLTPSTLTIFLTIVRPGPQVPKAQYRDERQDRAKMHCCSAGHAARIAPLW